MQKNQEELEKNFKKIKNIITGQFYDLKDELKNLEDSEKNDTVFYLPFENREEIHFKGYDQLEAAVELLQGMVTKIFLGPPSSYADVFLSAQVVEQSFDDLEKNLSQIKNHTRKNFDLCWKVFCENLEILKDHIKDLKQNVENIRG